MEIFKCEVERLFGFSLNNHLFFLNMQVLCDYLTFSGNEFKLFVHYGGTNFIHCKSAMLCMVLYLLVVTGP